MKIMAYFLTTSLLLSSLLHSSFASEDAIKVMIDGKRVDFSDVQPVNENGRVLVPARVVTERLGYKVHWIPETGLCIMVKGTDRIVMKSGDNWAVVNLMGKTDTRRQIDEKNSEVKVKNLNGRLLLPLRFISEISGKKVEWDEKTRTVIII